MAQRRSSGVELRTHGVSGAPVAELLGPADDPAARIVSLPKPPGGDGRTFYRWSGTGDGRRVEAYHWGASTSGGLTKSLWAVLIPFALVNVALWMIPIVRGPVAGRKPPSWWCAHMAVHLIGLALTVLIMTQLAFVMVEVLGAQFLAAALPAGLAAVTVTAALIAVPMAGAVLTRLTAEDLSGVHLSTYLDDHGVEGGPDSPAPRASVADDDFYDGNPIVGRLRVLHGIAAPVAVTLYVLALPGHGWAWLIPAAVLVLTAGALIWVSATAGRPNPRLLDGKVGLILVSGAFLGTAAVSVWVLGRSFETPGDAGDRLSTAQLVIGGVIVAALAAWLLLGVALVILRSRAKVAWHDHPAAFKPWLGGATAAVFTGVAIALGSGFGVGLARIVGYLAALFRRAEAADVPGLYDAIALQWGITAGALLLAVLGLVGRWWTAGNRKAPVAETISRTAVPEPEALRSLRRRVWLASLKHHAHRAVTAALAFTLGAAVVAVAVWSLPSAGGKLATLGTGLRLSGVIVLVVIVAAAGFAIHRAVSAPDGFGRTLGTVWDLAAFWPREGHPVVPPSYAPIAITEITDRVQQLADDGERQITLCGHSQGSLIMYAAALRLLEQDRHRSPPERLAGRLALVTCGSQLQWAYGRAFPAWLDFGSHQLLMAALDGRWINLARFTDPVGGPVLSWDCHARSDGEQVTVEAEILTGAGEAESSGPVEVDPDAPLKVGHEYWIPDPPVPPAAEFPRGHSNYLSEPLWPIAVTRLWDGDRAGG